MTWPEPAPGNVTLVSLGGEAVSHWKVSSWPKSSLTDATRLLAP
jgi:hypothetical protein